jgi:multiple sugar transport system substrate-binding protein
MKFSRFTISSLIIILTLAFSMGACDLFPSPGEGSGTPSSPVITIPPATLTAISAAGGSGSTPEPEPIGIPWSALEGMEIDFWYIWDLDEPGIGMNAIVDRFNNENPWGISVRAIDQGFSADPMQSIEAAFAEGVVPQIMVSDASAIAEWYQDGLLVDLNIFIDDPAAGLSGSEQDDYYPGVFEPFVLTGGVRPGLPFTQTIQVVFYNHSWADELGFSSPPVMPEDLEKQACRAARQEGDEKAAPTGIILYPEAASVTSWVYAYQGLLQDDRNGDYQLSSPEIRQVAQAWQDLQSQGCGQMVSQYPNPMAREMAFERFNQREALMVMGSALDADQISTMANHTGRADEWEMIPFLGPGGYKAVASEIQAGMVFNSSPEEELAAWLFLKYLTSPEVQAEWVQYSFYYPTRKDSLYLLRNFRSENPVWAKGVNVLKYAWIQPLDPSWPVVKQALGDAFEAILEDPGTDTVQILAELNRTAEELRDLSGK